MRSEVVERRLNAIPNLSRQGKRINGLFRLLASDDLWLRAYEEIASNQGALTPGVDRHNSLDGFSLKRVQRIKSAVLMQSYRFSPARRQHIPKPNGKIRPLGIPTADDKLVQAAVKLLLERVYEPVFSDWSHGFTIDHGILLDLLRKWIDDERLLKLIERMLRAGYCENWRWNPAYSGTPQGGVVSPLLANVYLHEPDTFMAGRKDRFDAGRKRRVSPVWATCTRRLNRLRVLIARRRMNDPEHPAIPPLQREMKEVESRRRTLSTGDPMDPTFRRLFYCRYADDLVIGCRAEAQQVMREVRTF